MAGLKQGNRGNTKRSFIRRRENRGGEGPPRKRESQLPLWKQIILVCLVGVSIMVVASWAVFSIQPTLFTSLKGRFAQQQSSPIVKKGKTPAPLNSTLTARTAKTRIVPTSAPTKPTVQQPRERIAKTIERPKVNIPSTPTRPTEPAPAMPSLPPKPQVSAPSSPSPTVEDDIVEEYLEIGSLYAKKGRYDKAEELFQKVTKENPSSAKAHNNLGFVYLKEEKYELAEKEFKEALRLDPASVLPYYNMACLYSRKGMEVEALIYLNRALKRDARVKLWAMTDEDFTGLRSDVVFQELIGIPSPQTGETFMKERVQDKEGVQSQESAPEQEKLSIPQKIQIPRKTTAPEERETPGEVDILEEIETPNDTPVSEEVQPPEESHGDTPQ